MINLYPQYTRNIRVKDKNEVMEDEMVKLELKKVEELIGGKGRVLLRKSGTEPVIRIMLECETLDLCESYADMIANVICERGYSI